MFPNFQKTFPKKRGGSFLWQSLESGENFGENFGETVRLHEFKGC